MRQLSVSGSLADVLNADLRLDATFYTNAAFIARKYVDDYGKVSSVEAFSAGTFNPPPIKRVYTDNPDLGTPYMLPQEMFDFYWAPKKFVIADKMPNIEDWYLEQGWIVLTQSGSVGKPYFATESDEELVLSQNAIRIPPRNKSVAGYVYSFLSTWIGQALLTKDQFGITVKHIRPKHVDDIPVPMIPKKKQEEISKKVEEAFKLRAKAIALLNEAKQTIYDELKAPAIAPTGEDDEVSDSA